MKAAIFHGPGIPLSIEDIPEPQPGPYEVLVKVGLCGICGSDVQMTSGRGMTYPHGVALGHEFCGEVVELGSAVDTLRVGDRIAAMPMSGCGACAACRRGRPIECVNGFRMMMGGFGEYTLADARYSVRMPSALSLTDGALVEPVASALRGVRMASIDPGARVLVLGAGAMGAGAVYWARRSSAGAIVASARSAWRERLMAKVGASGFVATPQLSDDLQSALGGPPDVVFECTGAAGLFATAIDLVRPGGAIVCLGICSTMDHFIPATAAYKEVSIRFSSAYSREEFEATVDAFDRGGTEPREMVEDIVPLEDVSALLETMRAGASRATKIHVNPGSGSKDRNLAGTVQR